MPNYNFQYSIKEKMFHGFPLIEVQINEQEWGNFFPYDQNFQFGLTKAKMVLLAMDEIVSFMDNNGNHPPLGHFVRINDEEYGILEGCERFNQFEVGGHIRNNSYLKLFGINDETFGFGIEKARALFMLEEEIKEFVSNHI